jgi:hypothetical protein
MLKYIATILIVFSLLNTISFSQSKKLKLEKEQRVERVQVSESQVPSFYKDYQLRKKSLLPKTNAEPQDLMFANYDWIYNDYVPNKLVMFDLDGDGEKDPIALGEHGDPTRLTRIAYIDDFGSNFYALYGVDNQTGIEYRTGYNGHLILDEANQALYPIVYDFLSGALLNYIWAIDLATDITAPTKVTTDTYSGGWPRMTLLASGDFLSIDDNTYDGNFKIMRSTDGGATFDSVNAIGADDPDFWFLGLANDPIIESNGTKVSIITKLERNEDDYIGLYEDLFPGEEGGVPEDSADAMYHYYSLDGGNTWQGEIFEIDGKKDQVINREVWPLISTWDKGDFVVSNDGVTHLIHIGINTITGIDTEGNITWSYPIYYWNDSDKNWMALSDTATENNDPVPTGVTYDRPGNMLGNSAGTIAVSEDGKVVAAVWVIPEYSGEWGHSDINIYPGDGGSNSAEVYYTDLVYAFSYDGGKTWSAPEALEEIKNYPEQWPVLSPIVEVNGDQATINYMYYMDPLPGSSILTEPSNGTSPDCKWVYNSKTFTIGSVGVNDDYALLKNYSLEQNYPNPFNPGTDIKFTLAKAGNVSLKVYDILGREVANLVNGTIEAGAHTVNFNASNLSSGVYLYTIKADNFSMTKKMMLMK